MPRVTVITPAYNAEPYIAETIRSVRAQTIAEWELIVQDDGSTDNTVAAARAAAEGDPRVRILTAPRGGRPAIARNRAIAHAQGEWIAFLDADDLYRPHKLETQLADLQRTAARWGFANTHIMGDDAQNPPGLNYPESWRPARPFFPQLLTGDGVPCLTLIVHRDELAVPPFDEDEGLTAVEDWDLALRLAERSEPHYWPQPLADYRIVPSSASRAGERNYARTMALIAKWRARGADPKLCAAAERRQLSKWATHRLFHGGDWRRDLWRASAALPLTAREAFFAALCALPRATAQQLYRKALAAQRR